MLTRLTKKRYEFIKKIVFYEKYCELASHFCQTKNLKNAWSQFEFWEIIKFCVVVIDFISM
jgi:hypothetical protein